jgi:hypothetical protein
MPYETSPENPELGAYLDRVLPKPLRPLVLGLPAFRAEFLDLVDELDDDLDLPAVVQALAGVVETGVRSGSFGADELTGVAAALDELVAELGEAATPVVGWSFIDALAPDAGSALSGFLGPRTRALAAQIGPRSDLGKGAGALRGGPGSTGSAAP